MGGDSSNYDEGCPPQGAQKILPICHEDDCHDTGSKSWREIFAVARVGAGPAYWPTLGVNFMRATQNTTIIRYNRVACCGGSPKGSCSDYATLTLGQDLRKLGLGAVVWDCVSATFLQPQPFFQFDFFISLLYMHITHPQA